MSEPIAAGQTFEFPYPFIRDDITEYDYDAEADIVTETKIPSWRPGVRFESDGQGDMDTLADGVGRQIVTVVSVHKPGRYPERVFYLRRWVSPDGKGFGKSRLMVKTSVAFRALISGYRYAYEVEAVRACGV